MYRGISSPPITPEELTRQYHAIQEFAGKERDKTRLSPEIT